MTIEQASELMKGFPKSMQNSSGELTKEGDIALHTIAKALNCGYTIERPLSSEYYDIN